MSTGNTAKRVWVSVITIPAILAASYLGNIYFYLFVLIIALVSFYEFNLLVKNKNVEVNLFVGYLSIIFVITNQYFFIMEIYPFILLVTVLISCIELFRKKKSPILNIGSTLLGIFYIGFFSSTLVSIREFYPSFGNLYYQGGFLVISILISIWVCDSAAFFGGTALGKHKLFPRVSPNKSWEGAIFGFVFSILSMTVLKMIILQFLSWVSVISLGIIVGVIGQIGDLVESLFKRDAGVKDSSNFIPGHGGIFDRFDSLLFSAPVILLYLRYFTS